MAHEVSHVLEEQDRIGIEVIPSVARWEGGSTTQGVTTVILRINGIGFPHLGYRTLFVVHTCQLAAEERKAELLRTLELLKLRGDLAEAERQFVCRWLVRIEKMPTMLDQEWFCDESFLAKMGVVDVEGGDSHT